MATKATKMKGVGTTARPSALATKSQAAAATVDPFKTRKTNDKPSKSANDVVIPPPDIQEAIDAFREDQAQAKHFEGEAAVQKNTISGFATEEYAKRLMHGQPGSFKMQGLTSTVLYVVTDSSSGLTEEERDEFAKKWGKAAAEKLIVKDYGSVRFNADVLEAHYDEVVQALQVLPPEVLGNLFKPMMLKAAPEAQQLVRSLAKDEGEAQAMLDGTLGIKPKNYLR